MQMEALDMPVIYLGGSYLFAAAEAGVIVYTTVLAHRAIGNKFEKRKKLFPLLLGTVAILTGNLFVALPGNFFPV